MACSDKSARRKSLLGQLKDLVKNIDDKCCPCPSPCGPCGPCGPCAPCVGPVIEIYDPLPKPCLPVCSPCCPAPCGPCGDCCGGCPKPCGPCGGCGPCCPPCNPCCPPPNCTAPVPLCSPACCTPVVPPCLPICTPVPPPCVPICNPCPEPQPCVPCNPPQMMVCYKLPKCGLDLRGCKSRELRASILYTTCDCIKRNGLQDDCPRSECHGAPCCLTFPDPQCCPGRCARAYRDGPFVGKKNGLEEYQCYPAYVKLPGGPCPCAPPICPAPGCCGGGPCVPLVAAPPCPPPICPCPPPALPIGNVIPIVNQCCPPCPCPC